MASTDREALIALYNATDGDNWTGGKNTNWCTDADLSEWHGVQVSKGRVVALYLLGSNLRGMYGSAVR